MSYMTFLIHSFHLLHVWIPSKRINNLYQSSINKTWGASMTCHFFRLSGEDGMSKRMSERMPERMSEYYMPERI